MAKTQLADIIIPAQFAAYVIQRTAEKSDLFLSGIVQANPDYDTRAAQGGTQVNMPHWNDLTGPPATVKRFDTAFNGEDRGGSRHRPHSQRRQCVVVESSGNRRLLRRSGAGAGGLHGWLLESPKPVYAD